MLFLIIYSQISPPKPLAYYLIFQENVGAVSEIQIIHIYTTIARLRYR